MLKQIKLDALLIISLIVTGGMGYTVAYAADTSSSQVSNTTDFQKTLTSLETNQTVNGDAYTLNKKVSLSDNKEFMPGISHSEKDPNMGDVTSTQTSQDVDHAPVQDSQPEQIEASQQAITQAAAEPPVEMQSTGKNVGTFKISFYDPAVLGSDMGYSGVATNLSVIPRGSSLKITTAQGDVYYRTVNDTGTFAYDNPYQIDMAMPNSMIPSYGITSATVEIIG
ncbi:hydrolase [Companilactobacillus musae]|uniref:hydrolase n=1 Tax=Companilactobacillus musae TaxID=1903258 RepID=UPI001FE844C3|nr:hydrolase [Companilactobacillus musae]